MLAWNKHRLGEKRAFGVGLAASLGVVGVALSLASDFWVLILITSGIYAITALGLIVLTGYAGQISFGHNAFLAVGAYSSALGTTRWDLPPLVALAIGVVLSVALAVAVGTPALRLRGHYLALATLAFGLAVYAFASNSGLTKGFIGISGVPPFGVLGLEALEPRAIATIIWAAVLASVVAVWLIGRSRFGEMLRAIKDDEELASSCGIATHRVKVLVFALSAIFASVAGSLEAHALSYVSAELFSLQTIALLFIILFVGGLNVWGVGVAAVAITVAPQELAWLAEWQTTVLGLILLGVLLFKPRVGRLAALRGQRA